MRARNNARHQRLDDRVVHARQRRPTHAPEPDQRNAEGAGQPAGPEVEPLSLARSTTPCRSAPRVLRRPDCDHPFNTRARRWRSGSSRPHRLLLAGPGHASPTALEHGWSSPASVHPPGSDRPTLQGPTDDIDANVQDVVLDWTRCRAPPRTTSRSAPTRTSLTVVENRTNIVGTRYSPPTTLNNDQYYWRVRPSTPAATASTGVRHRPGTSGATGRTSRHCSTRPTTRPSATPSTTSGPRCRTPTGTSSS